MHNWSKYQEAIFKETAEGSQHCIIEAVAGAGKSTVLRESLKYIPEGKDWLLIAFNKKIADELKAKVSLPGNISTIHARGLNALGSAFPRLVVDNEKLPKIIEKLIGKNKDREYKANLEKAVNFCKATLAQSLQEIDDVLDEYELDVLEHDRDEFVNNILICMEKCRKNMLIVDFMDMVWGPNVHKLKVKKYDFICIDEYQDLNRAQIEFALQLCKKKGRVFCFGDPKQSIYNFMAAGYDKVFNSLKTLNPKIMPLSISYRCPKAVIKVAQKYVPEIEAWEHAKEGEVHNITEAEMMKLAKPGCFILSRSNAPMLKICLAFLKQNIPSTIRGRDIGQNLLSFIEHSKAASISSLKNYLDKWRGKELERLQKKNKDTAHIQDKYECIMALCEDHKSVEQVVDRLKTLFSDNEENNKILLSTVHRAKGDEREEVFILKNTFFGSDTESNNIRYVACTRSKNKLYYVSSKKKEEPEDDQIS